MDLTETVIGGFEKELNINPRNEKYSHMVFLKPESIW